MHEGCRDQGSDPLCIADQALPPGRAVPLIRQQLDRLIQ